MTQTQSRTIINFFKPPKEQKSYSDEQIQMPLSPLIFHILSELFGGKKLHGHDIMTQVENEMDTHIPTATVYRTLKELRAKGWIELTAPPENAMDDRRKYFQITDPGKRMYASEYNRLRKLLAKAEQQFKENPAFQRNTP
ncbi:MAG: PadR family transcriptional regulator [Chloroflexota bacterium]